VPPPTEAQSLASSKKPASDGCTVITDFLFNGRSRGNRWKASLAENLMLRWCGSPGFWPRPSSFNSARPLVRHSDSPPLLGPEPSWSFEMAWDLYHGDQKLASTLIENSLSGTTMQHSIVGIGPEYQPAFDNA
jgi:BirA family biotin operon repressor/biotin-[acetyl-CoA-carboxylase] ligase